jgi:diacylglycerol kinase family enzyme
LLVRGVLFLNPRAGTFSGPEHGTLRDLAIASGLEVVEIEPSIEVGKVVRDNLSRGRTTFVVAGGDGSVHHVAQALVNTNGVLGVVPAGSVNHLARDLDLPLDDWRAAFEIAINGTVEQIDVGRVNEHYFINSLMMGVYPTISKYRERFRSTSSRWVAYFKAARLALRHFPHVTLVLELGTRMETLRTQLFILSVNEYDLSTTGMIAPKLSLSDGRLTMYALAFTTRLRFIRAAAKYFRGKVTDVEGFRRVRMKELRIDAAHDHLRVSIDGELVDLPTPLQVTSVPSGLLVRRSRGVDG